MTTPETQTTTVDATATPAEGATDTTTQDDVTETPAETPAEGTPPADGSDQQPEGDKAEEKPEEKPVETPEALKLRKGWAALNREKKQLQNQRAEFKALERKAQVFDKIEAKLQSDPLGLLEELGIDYLALTDAYLERGTDGKKPPPKVDDRVAALEKQLQDERQAREQQANVTAYQKTMEHITGTIKTAGDQFELVNATEAYEAVADVLIAYHKQHNERLPIEDAAALVEEQLEAEAARFAKSKKFSGARQPAQTKPAPTKPSNSPIKPRPGATTLANTSRDAAPTGDDLPTDPEKRWEALLKGL